MMHDRLPCASASHPGASPSPLRPAAFRAAAALLVASAVLVSCFGLDEKEETALSLYKQNSKSYYNSDKFEEAVDQCRKGLAIEPDDFSLSLTYAWCLLRMGGQTNLFAAYERFHSLDDDDFRVQLGLGQTCYKISILFQDRMDELQRRSASAPEKNGLFEEERKACQEGRTQYLAEATENLTAVLENERQKENIDAILTLGQVHAYSGELNKAVDEILHGLDLLADSTSFQQKQLDADKSITGDGRRFFERQIKRNLKWEKELRGLLAFVYQREQHHDKALEQYNILAEHDLFDDIQYYNRGLSLQALGRYEEAQADFEKFLARASVTGKNFDEDEHFHLAFERIEACKRHAQYEDPAPASAAETAVNE